MALRQATGDAIVDLTQALSNDMPVYPGMPQPSFVDIADVATDGYAMSELRLLNHIGTHIDAPAHQIAGGDTLDEIPLGRLVTAAVVLDFSSRDPHGSLTVEDIEPHLEDIAPGEFVLISSDNGRHWGTDAYWTGWSYPDADAAQALIAAGVSGIGFDGPSADPVDTTTFAIHKVWLSAGRLILENLTNLERLPPRIELVVAPLKLRHANGAQARVLAWPAAS